MILRRFMYLEANLAICRELFIKANLRETNIKMDTVGLVAGFYACLYIWRRFLWGEPDYCLNAPSECDVALRHQSLLSVRATSGFFATLKPHSKYTEFDNYYICERMVLFRNYFARKWRWSLIRKTSNKTRSNLQFLSL